MILQTPTQRARTHALLTRLFLAAVARLNPAERTAQALADADWKPATTVLVAAGKSALSMASGVIIHLTSRGLPLAGGVVVVPEHALVAHPLAAGSRPDMDAIDELAGVVGRGGVDGAGDAGAPAPGEEPDPSGPDGHGAPGDAPPAEGREPSAGTPGTAEWPLVCAGEHPVPGQGSLLAARQACRVVSQAPPDAEILVLLSGGASALMSLPAPGLSLADKNTVVSAVAASGADRPTINMVRKHLSAIKGGRLAALSPVPMTTLVASDVVGDDLSAVGSGPTLPDPSTVRQACDVIAATMSLGAVPWRVRAHLEATMAGDKPDTPESGRPGDRVALLAGINALVDAAVALARDMGLTSRPFARELVGDVSEVARRIAVQARRVAAAGPGTPLCFAGGGEPTLALPRTPGVGGRAQQTALMVARELAGVGGVTVLIAASDGIDGNSDAAGAIVDGHTWDSVIAAGVDPDQALARCDAGTALAAAGATVITGATEINHGDLVLIAAGV